MKQSVRYCLIFFGLCFVLVLFAITAIVISYPRYEAMTFPDGKKFAFTICDDTDRSTVENVKPVYDLLQEFNMRTTRAIWVYPTNDSTNWANWGETLSDSLYRMFVLDLRDKGFEIASHGIRGGVNHREEILAGMDYFKDVIGYYPRIHINHSLNPDNIYWGRNKIELKPLRALYDLVMDRKLFAGHVPESEFFWADFVQKHIKYMVNFSFHEINIAAVNPLVPYHDPDKPFVKYWFHTSDGRAVNEFNDLLSPENLDQLENEGGVCIVYTHFGFNFVENGVCDSTFTERIKDLASRDGWFVPASEILDYMIKHGQGGGDLSFTQRVYLEFRWLYEKLIYGAT
ncbi:MAG: hypothetical protein J7L96_02455 [Bacteroidales bacterium]|nr:hypothetical protein [Bacteroidales bacterium]